MAALRIQVSEVPCVTLRSPAKAEHDVWRQNTFFLTEPRLIATDTDSSSNAWIAGAVAGPVAAIILLLLDLFLLQRRRRLQGQKQTGGVVIEEKLEKAQLHGGSPPIRNPIFELDAV